MSKILTVFLFLLFSVVVYSQTFKEMTASDLQGIGQLFGNFKQVQLQSDVAPDTIEGTFYFSAPDWLLLKVTFPLNQIMVINGNVTEVYYPESRRAFRFTSEKPVTLPLVNGLMTTLRPDYGMSDFGFEVFDQKIKGDTLFSYWSHPEVRDQLGDFEVAEVNDRLIYSFYRSPNDNHTSRIDFQDYYSEAGFNFPQKIQSEIVVGRTTSMEYVVLDSMAINQPLPPGITNFRIPDDADIVEKEW